MSSDEARLHLSESRFDLPSTPIQTGTGTSPVREKLLFPLLMTIPKAYDKGRNRIPTTTSTETISSTTKKVRRRHVESFFRCWCWRLCVCAAGRLPITPLLCQGFLRTAHPFTRRGLRFVVRLPLSWRPSRLCCAAIMQSTVSTPAFLGP